MVMTAANAQATRHLRKKSKPFDAATSVVSSTLTSLSLNFSVRAVFILFCFSSLMPSLEENCILIVEVFEAVSSPRTTVALSSTVSETVFSISAVFTSPS